MLFFQFCFCAAFVVEMKSFDLILVFLLFQIISCVEEGAIELGSNEPIANERTESNTVSPITIQHNKYIYNLYPNDEFLRWGTSCSFITDYWLEFASIALEPNHFFLELNPRIGHTFIPITQLLPEGAAIAYQKVTLDTDLFHQNIGFHESWNRTVIVTHRVDVDLSFRDTSIAGNIMTSIAASCAHFILLRQWNREDLPVYEFIADSVQYLQHCSTILYIDYNQQTPYLQEIVHLLTINEYQVFLQPLSCNCPLKMKEEELATELSPMVRHGLIAIPKNITSHSRYSEIALYLQRWIPISDFNIELFSANAIICHFDQEHINKDIDAATRRALIGALLHSNSRLKQKEKDGDSRFYGLFSENSYVKALNSLEITSAKVELSILLDYASPLRCLLRTYLNKNEHLVIPFPLVVGFPEKSYRALIQLQCIDWVTMLFQNLEFAACPPISLLDQHRISLFHSCIQFSSERISFLAKVYSRRFQEQQLYYNQSYASISTNGEDEEIPTSWYMHYDVQSNPSEWFEREPFETKFDPDVCGEPIFCATGEEIKRRIHLWQNPPLNQQLVSHSSKAEDNPFPAERTCENAKFLIYEPPSNLHGIGSMLEVTAAAMRFAICLDRILVPLQRNQLGTMLKWRPAGCQTNPFDCYFQPLSHCPIDPEELLNPEKTIEIRASGSLDLSLHPWRRYKYIIYHGLPVDGPCQLCFDTWPESSTFFDGIELSRADFDTNYFEKKLFQAVAFTEKNKLPWLSQFLRYLLRPRPWFQEGLKEIVYQSMVSPAIRIRSEGKSYLVQLTKFPESFLSLHVRFGMKRVEVALEPITRYIHFMKKKLPYLTDIFISTETEAILPSLIR